MSPNRIDFYLLEEAGLDQRGLFTCRLLEKAWLKGHRLFVFCTDQKEAEDLDELLWTFKPDSFIPHNLQGEGPEPPPPIQIGYSGQMPRGFNDVLINLSDRVPEFYQRFRRIIEIIPNAETQKAIGREHYKYFRQQGLTINTLSWTDKQEA